MAELVVPEDILPYLTAPASLQSLASTSLALHACSYDRFLRTEVELNPPVTMESCREAILNKVTPLIKQIIDDRLRSMGKQLRLAFKYLIKIRIRDLNSAQYKLIYQCFTYGADATISYEASGRNLMNCSSLKEQHKYVVACQCCFEEDVRRLWPLVSHIAEINQPDFVEFPLLRYWASRMMSTQDLYPTHRDIVDHWRVSCCVSWPALKYLWSKSTPEEQLSVIDTIFRADSHSGPNVDQIVTKLNATQLNYVWQSYPHLTRIIVALSYNELHFEYLLQIWNHCKASISDDQFSTLIKILYERVFKCSQHNAPERPMYRSLFFMTSAQIRCQELAHQRKVLHEIWASATLASKTAFIDSQVEELLAATMQFDRMTDIECHNHDMSFFHSLLANMSFERRNALWLKYWKVILIRVKPKFLDDFLKLCLKEDEEQFVEKQLMSFNAVFKFIHYLVTNQEYDDLIDYVNLRTSSETVSQNLRQMIIRIIPYFFEKQISKSSIFNDLPNFVSRLSVSSIEAAYFMKSIFVSSLFQNMVEKNYHTKINNEMNWKEYLFYHQWIEYLVNPETRNNGELCENRWNEFWFWIKMTPDDGTLSPFKEYLSVNKIFVVLILQAVERLTRFLGNLEWKRSEDIVSSSRNLDEFKHLDEFLMWYFGDKKIVRKYKAEVMKNCEKWPTLMGIFKGGNECVINDVLRWCFDGDIIEIGNFKISLLVEDDLE